MNIRPLTSVLACAIPLLLVASCEEAAHPLGSSESPVGTGPRDATAKLDASTALKVTRVEAAGSGCPRGSWKATPMVDGSGYELSFDQYSLSLNPERPQLESSACNITLQVDVPAGTTYALRSSEYVGDAQFGPAASAELIVNTAFTGVGTSTPERRVKVPGSGPFTVTAEATELAWAPCELKSNPQQRPRPDLLAQHDQAPVRDALLQRIIGARCGRWRHDRRKRAASTRHNHRWRREATALSAILRAPHRARNARGQ
jgi:hypothetical protein